MERNYTDETKPQTVALTFEIRRAGKANTDWRIQVLEREYANVTQDDTDYFKDNSALQIGVTAASMAESFDIVDPTTLEPTGQTAFVGQLFALIQSYYIAKARARDAAADALAAATPLIP